MSPRALARRGQCPAVIGEAPPGYNASWGCAAQVIDEVPVIALGFFLERPSPLRAYSSIGFWRTGGIAWIVVAWDFAFDIPGKPENA